MAGDSTSAVDVVARGPILVATDLTCQCDRALDRAVELAAEWQTRLVALHVLEEHEPVRHQPSWRRPPNARDVALRRIGRDVRPAHGVVLDVVVERGDPASVILETAARMGCSLIVLGIGRDPASLGSVLLGTVTSKLARRSSIPLLVVKLRPRGPYTEVVVATDFSEGSRDALLTALDLLPAAHMRLFHAYEALRAGGFVSDDEVSRQAAARHAIEEGRRFREATPALAESGRSIGGAGPLWSSVAASDRHDVFATSHAAPSEGRGNSTVRTHRSATNDAGPVRLRLLTAES